MKVFIISVYDVIPPQRKQSTQYELLWAANGLLIFCQAVKKELCDIYLTDYVKFNLTRN